MEFIGISKIFSTLNDRQYVEIGEYWDYFSHIYGRENIKGLGFHWEENSLEYVIGMVDQALSFDMEQIHEKYPDAIYKKVLLPEEGWRTYEGQTEHLAELYGAIYQEGVLTYEIESFYDNGDCKVEITRCE